MKKRIFSLVLSVLTLAAAAQVHVSIADPETWTVAELTPYIGQTVIFDTPLIVTSNYNGLAVSPRRIFSPTNQERPGTTEYYNIGTLNANGSLPLYAVSGYHRMGEKIYNLEAKVAANSLTFVSGEWRGNTRSDLEKGIPNVDISGEHTLLVCGANLEYYLVEQYSSPGPKDNAQHQKQRAKVSKALAKINADIYGLVEVQQGNNALKEIAEDLTKNTGRTFTYVHEVKAASGTYTKSGYVYCSDVVETVGEMQHIETGVANRKKMQLFREKATGELFIYSINHFKAKSGGGVGADADQGDGQGGYNNARKGEASAVLTTYKRLAAQLGDESDILIMGDLNAYGKEDPIMVFVSDGMTDLHRWFHRDSSYSYTYHSEAGYLDHAISNETLLPQITGMAAYHINSDEDDAYTYDKSSDATMFRCSDHDPVLVGLRLDGTKEPLSKLNLNSWEVYNGADGIYIRNAAGVQMKAYYRIYSVDGRMLEQDEITDDWQLVPRPAQAGLYVVVIYHEGQTYKFRVIIP